MNCSYCDTQNHENIDKCTFCNAPMIIKRPKRKELLIVDHAEKSFEELIQYHTYDLLVLLRLVRSERSTAFDMMISIQRLLKKAPEGLYDDSVNVELVKHAENDYKRFTARMKVLEGLLIDRMGYKPKRIDDKLLNALNAKIERGN